MMNKMFNSELEITDLVRSFEDATIAREDWHHAQHLTVALYYLTHHDIDTATAKMRDGIFKLLSAFAVDLTKEMPYHETLTIFWIRTVEEFSRAASGMSIVEKANSLVEKFDKDYPLKFYSREVLFSDAARAGFVEGDLRQ